MGNFAVVIDINGYAVDYVVLSNGVPLHYTLKEGESLITTDYRIATGMLKPQWTGTEWIETEVVDKIEDEVMLTTNQKVAVLQEKISILQSQIPELEAQICELVLADMEGDED